MLLIHGYPFMVNVVKPVILVMKKMCSKQASLKGCLTTLKKERSFWPQLVRHDFFTEVSALLDNRHYPKMQFCAMSRKTNVAALRK